MLKSWGGKNEREKSSLKNIQTQDRDQQRWQQFFTGLSLLKMTITQIVEMSVTNNSRFQDYFHTALYALSDTERIKVKELH